MAAEHTSHKAMLHTGVERATATVVPNAGGYSRIVDARGQATPGPADLHALLEDLLAQQIAQDRRIGVFLGVERA